MTKRFVVTKDEITQTITYKEYDNFKGMMLNQKINYLKKILLMLMKWLLLIHL